MATLIKQWDKYVYPCNEYLAVDANDVDTITPILGDKVYVISTGEHKIYDGSAWQAYKTPTAYTELTP